MEHPLVTHLRDLGPLLFHDLPQTLLAHGDIADVARRAGFKPVTSGANISLIEPYDAGGREIDGIHLASPVQVYLDLLSFRGRGEEAAQAVLDEVIRPTW